MNKEFRKERAQRALDAFDSDDTGDAPFIDLIADLLILANSERHDTGAIVRMAVMHFHAEEN